AIESTKLCSMIQWEHILSFCKMLSSTKHGVDRGFSEYTLVGFVEKAYEDGAGLLELLNHHNREKINEMFTHFLETWFEADNLFCIPHPVAVVRQWVKIQYENTQENGALDNVSTICSIVPSLIHLSKFCIILSEELKQYQENSSSNSDLCEYMDKCNRSLISKTKSESYELDFSISLIDCGARLASCGSICRSDSIKYTDRAISILHDLENSETTGQVQYLLLKAYCSNALFKRIVHPRSKEFIEDINGAIKAYESECLAEINFCEEDQNLFYYVADLLVLEGYMVQHARLYKMMLKRAALGGINIHTTLDMAWNTGSLSHALCASPVDPLFMETLLELNIKSDGVQFWTDGMGESQKVGVELCLSVCPTISSVNSHSDAHAIKAQKTIDEIKSAASMQGHTDFDNFKAARMYYHLAERLTANGLVTEVDLTVAAGFWYSRFGGSWKTCKGFASALSWDSRKVITWSTRYIKVVDMRWKDRSFRVIHKGAQGDREAEVFQVSNDDTVVAHRRLEDKQPKEKKKHELLSKRSWEITPWYKGCWANITVTEYPGQGGDQRAFCVNKAVPVVGGFSIEMRC
ncbi:hypothetical protein Tco_0720673, partial [Tanacetum coccineum]